MKEYPVFVPFGDAHLATTITVPDGHPRAVVILSTGVGANRSHRFQMWARLAERLAGIGVASARFDYEGVHDSTGTIGDIMISDLPMDQMLAITSFARRAVGVERVFAVGNCMGARLSLHLAGDDPKCVGAVCINFPMEEPGYINSFLRKVVPGSARAALKSSEGMRRVLARVRRRTMRTEQSSAGPLARALDHAAVLFLYGSDHFESQGEAFARLGSVIGVLPPKERDRFELRVLQGGALERFGSVEMQLEALEEIESWVDGRLVEVGPPASAAAG